MANPLDRGKNGECTSVKRPNERTQIKELRRVAAAAGGPDQPTPLYDAMQAALAQVIGHRLFTLMVFDPHNREAQRLYSSDPKNYPVGGRKAMSKTPWGEKVIDGKIAWIGYSAEDIRWAYPDHELIASLGLESALNLPVIYDDVFIGSANLLHDANWYTPQDVEIGKPFAALLAAPFRDFARLS